METVLRCVWLGCLAIGLGWPAGWAVGDAPPAETGLRVSGPYVHDNLTVFLLHRDGADDTRFITITHARGVIHRSASSHKVHDLQPVAGFDAHRVIR